MIENELSLVDGIKNIVDKMLSGIHTSIPGSVIKYDSSVCKADIRPSVYKTCKDDTILQYPIITCVPVVWSRTKESIIHMPLKVGDTGILIFSEKSIDVWLKNKDNSIPEDVRKFDLSDAIFIPGVFQFFNKIDVKSTDVTIKYKKSTIVIDEEGTITIKTDKNSINVDSDGSITLSGTSFKLGTVTKKLINDGLLEIYNAHTHPVVGASTGIPVVPLLAAAVATLKTEAE